MNEIIKEIFKQEERASDQLRPAAFNGLRSLEDQRKAACWLFKAQSQYRHELSSGEWGCYARGFPILHQLLHQPTLIVNIYSHKDRPDPATSFVEEYGITPDQMAELVDAGLVVPNLYEAADPRGYDLPHLQPLFRSSERWIQNGFRLKSLRSHLQQSIPDELADFGRYTSALLKLVNECDERQLALLYGQQVSRESLSKMVEVSWSYLHEFAASGSELSESL